MNETVLDMFHKIEQHTNYGNITMINGIKIYVQTWKDIPILSEFEYNE